MSRDAYIQKMRPYANRVADAVGISADVVLSHWILETGSGSSALIKRGSNNHAGIKANSSGRDFVSGAYSGYNSIDSFVRDYIRLINTLPYYKNVRNQSDPYNAIKELHKSPWAEDPNQDKKLIDIYNAISSTDELEMPKGSNSNYIVQLQKDLNSMDNQQVQQMALVGLGVVTLLALIKN